jgi:predicted ribosome quality control (RQC) complex YloA/Tae2 family protein
MIIEKVYDSLNSEELDIHIGKNAQENWDLIDNSDENDMWFHLADHPSPHVILKSHFMKNKISSKTIAFCATKCKENSKMKNLNKITVIYTEIKNVSKADKVGAVFTKKISKVVV